MKVTKKLLLLGLTIAMLLTATVPAFALPGNTVVIGDKAFSLDYFFDSPLNSEITAAIADGGDIYLDVTDTGDSFKDAYDGSAITDPEKAAINNIGYLNYDGSRATYANFDDKTPVGEELTVEGIEVIDRTHIEITFSNDDVRIFVLDSGLAEGDNTVTFTYLGQSFTETVTYHQPQPAKVAAVEASRDDYRHFQVRFNGMVDLASAERPENYYFFINEGTADYKAVLPASNQLDTIGATLKATNVDGKTVVDIYLPEDARFTNIADFLPGLPGEPTQEFLTQIPLYQFWTGPYGFDQQAWLDDEETIVVNKANDVHGLNSNFWALTAGREVQVAVRNVRDLDGERSINTAVLPMQILDDVRPAWESVYAIDRDDKPLSELFIRPEAAAAVPEVPIYTDNSERIRLEFDEPVFDTHGLGVGDINNTGHYDVQVSVDDFEVASTEDLNLEGPGGILKFYMGADDSYYKSSLVDLDIKKAIERRYSDGFRADNTYTIKITGITDLAGNITNPQVLEFKVKLLDKDGDGPIVIAPPQIIAVDQIHDNVFRVFINRPDVTGQFEIRNADGEDGLILLNLADFQPVPTKYNGEDVWYKDVYVRATDIETSLGIGVRDDNILAYDNQNTLNRTLRISSVANSSGDGLTGNSYEKLLGSDPFVIKKDIYAPVVENPATIKWQDIGSTIVLDVKDIVPDTWYQGDATAQPVYAMLYDYQVKHQFNNEDFGVFDLNSIDSLATESYNMGPGWWSNINGQFSFDLLPITVSYTKGGVKHTELITNRNLLEESANYDDESGRHYGVPGSLDYDVVAQKLYINLAPGSDDDLWYKDLLDADGNLIQGVNYEIEIPNGYFADAAKFNAYNFTDWAANTVSTASALWYIPDDKILYVSDARNNNSWLKDREYTWSPAIYGDGSKSYLVHGYTSAETTVIQPVEVAPVIPEEPKDAVPQTSKELINWFEDRNEIWVEFTGSIDPATLKNPANYVLNDKTLAEMGVTPDDIDYVVSNENIWNGDPRQFAQIKLPYDTISVDGDYLFKVSGVANLAGGTMTPVEVRLDIDENFRPVIESAVVIGDHEIELTFNESVRYTADPAVDPEEYAINAKDNFVVYVNGTAFTPTTATVGTAPYDPALYVNPEYPLNKVVRLHLGSVALLGDVHITVEIVPNQNGKLVLEDHNCNPLNDDVAPFVVK